MHFVFIDDDADNRRQWREWGEYRGHDVQAVETAFEANGYSADVFVFDVSACGAMMVAHHVYAPICRLMQDHPYSKIVIGSCVSRNYVNEVLDDIEEVSGKRPLFFDASRGFEGLDEIMKQLK